MEKKNLKICYIILILLAIADIIIGLYLNDYLLNNSWHYSSTHPWVPVFLLIAINTVLAIALTINENAINTNYIKIALRIIVVASIVMIILIALLYNSLCTGRYNDDVAKQKAYKESKWLYYSARVDYLEGKITEEEYNKLIGEQPIYRSSYSSTSLFASDFLPPIIYYILNGLLLPIIIYPYRIAKKNDHPQSKAILWISILFGTTIILWIIMLMWAGSTNEATANNKSINTDPPVTDKLKELKNMLDEELITEEEYESKRKDLISKM